MRPTDDELIDMCGGRPKTEGGEPVLYFGMNPSDQKHTDEIVSAFDENPDLPKVLHQRVCLWNFAKQLNGGKHVPYNWQLTGSCVNGGANNCLSVLIAGKILRDGNAAAWHVPFTLPAYGESRRLCGWTSEGEGSSGDAMAIALANFGYTAYDFSISGIPTPKVYDAAYCYTKQVEYQFSASRGCPSSVKEACKGYKIRFEKLTTLEQCELSIRRCRPFTIAGNWGSTMKMGYKSSGPNRVLWGSYASKWEHQMSCLGVWNHPELGRIWAILQQWYYIQNGIAVPVHGAPGTDEPPGVFWVDDSMIQHQLNYRFGELRAFVDNTAFEPGMLSTLAV